MLEEMAKMQRRTGNNPIIICTLQVMMGGVRCVCVCECGSDADLYHGMQ